MLSIQIFSKLKQFPQPDHTCTIIIYNSVDTILLRGKYIKPVYLFTIIISITITLTMIIAGLKRSIQGTKISTKKLVLYLIYYLIVVSFLVYNSFSLGIPLYYIVPYGAILTVSGLFSYLHSKKNLLFWIDNNSRSTFVKGGVLIYISYVSALVLRIAINAVFIGFQEINFTERGDIVMSNIPLVPIDHNTMTTYLIAADFLLMLGSGMFIGRNARVIEFVYRRGNPDHNTN